MPDSIVDTCVVLPIILKLLVVESLVIQETRWRRVAEVLRKLQEISRKRPTLTRGGAERLLWSDESVRSELASQFLGAR